MTDIADEQVAEYRAVFNLFDKDKSGCIDIVELGKPF